MDSASLAKIIGVNHEHVKVVIKQCNDNPELIERAVNQYLDTQSGPFKEDRRSNTDEDGFASIGKPRRGKKVRTRRARVRSLALPSSTPPAPRRRGERASAQGGGQRRALQAARLCGLGVRAGEPRRREHAASHDAASTQ